MVQDQSVSERIMEVATRLFYTQGYNLTGINQVISEASIAKASLYSHYPSKTDLLLSYLEEQSKTFSNGLVDFLSKLETPREKIIGIFEYHLEAYALTDFGGCPFLKIKSEVAKNEDEVLHKVKLAKAGLRALIANLVAGLKDKTMMPKKNLTDTLYFLLEGATVTASVTRDSAEILSAIEIAKKLL